MYREPYIFIVINNFNLVLNLMDLSINLYLVFCSELNSCKLNFKLALAQNVQYSANH